jgi:dihydroxy-acid dehydratase
MAIWQKKGLLQKLQERKVKLFTGPARVFENEFEAIEGIRSQVQPGDVIVIRNSGPKGAPGMPEMLKPTSAVMGAGLGKDVALITDGRFSGGSHGFVVGHITPEAYEGGTIGLIKNGDRLQLMPLTIVLMLIYRHRKLKSAENRGKDLQKNR